MIGFDLQARSWVTRAGADDRVGNDRVAEGRIVGVPPLDGELRVAGMEPYATDFGRILSRRPRVLVPGSVDDIVKIVRFAPLR